MTIIDWHKSFCVSRLLLSVVIILEMFSRYYRIYWSNIIHILDASSITGIIPGNKLGFQTVHTDATLDGEPMYTTYINSL